jgi:RNA polymerase sigma-70 factor (ECF subfamily)
VIAHLFLLLVRYDGRNTSEGHVTGCMSVMVISPRSAAEDRVVPINEAEAIRAFIRTRDESTFRDLFGAVAPRLLRYFLRRGCSDALADELTLETMYTVYRGIGSLRVQQSFQAWLFSIARNALYREYRKSMKEPATERLDAASLVSDPSAEFWRESRSGFDHLIAHLPPEEREVLELRYVEELGYEEIAAVLEVPLGTVKWRIHNSKRKLAELVDAK